MLLKEIFSDQYYNQLQHQIKPTTDSQTIDGETSVGDFIITSFEQDQLTFEEAMKQIRSTIPKGEQFFWIHELNMADELKKDTNNDNA